MTEFKVGDRVRIKDEFKPEEHRDGAEFVCEMDKYIGNDFYVDEVEEGYILNDGWAFHPDWLKLVERKRTSKTISVFDGVREVKMFDKGGVISLQFKKLVRD